jgi:sigma-E factor negative regulatory protein RseA
MNEKLRESVSALVDGEADDLELRRLLAGAEEMAGVRAAWRDYHLQRDSLNGVDMTFAHIDISQRVQAALADEAIAAAPVGARWWRPLASVAVAASVATVVVIGARSFSPVSDNSAALAQVSASSAVNRVFPAQSGPAVGNVAVSAQLNTPLYPAQTVALDPDQLAQQRLQMYLLRHTERAALNNGQGVISFAKVSQLNAE